MLQSFLAAVLLSASVERFGVSRMRDFFHLNLSCVIISKATMRLKNISYLGGAYGKNSLLRLQLSSSYRLDVRAFQSYPYSFLQCCL